MKKILHKTGRVESISNLYTNLQAAHISNIDEYLRGTILKTGLRLQGNAFMIRIEGGQVIIALGACVFPNYEVFVAPPNTELSLDIPDFANINDKFAVVLSQEYVESEYRYVVPLRDVSGQNLFEPAIEKVGVSIIIIDEASYNSADNTILLGFIITDGSQISHTDLRHESALRILSKYMNWNMSALLPIDVSYIESFSVRSNDPESSGVVTPPINRLTYVRVFWEVPEASLTEDDDTSQDSLYYKVRLVPVYYLNYPSDPVPYETEAIEIVLRYDSAIFPNSNMHADILCAEGVIYKASVYRIANPIGIVISEAGSTKDVLAGIPADGPSSPQNLTLEILGPNDTYFYNNVGQEWNSDLIYIRPKLENLTGLLNSDLKYQLFIEETGVLSPAQDIENKNYMFYEGAPRGCFYAPRGEKDKINILGRLIGRGGLVVACSVINNQTFENLAIYSGFENVLALQVPYASNLGLAPAGVASAIAGLFRAPYDMIVTKIVISNPNKDYIGGSDDPWLNYLGVDPPGELILEGDDEIVATDYPVSILLGSEEVIKDFSEDYGAGTYPVISAGEKITATMNATTGTIIPDGLIVLIYTRKVLM